MTAIIAGVCAIVGFVLGIAVNRSEDRHLKDLMRTVVNERNEAVSKLKTLKSEMQELLEEMNVKASSESEQSKEIQQ